MNYKNITVQEAQAVKQLIDRAKNVVITCHTNPDGDAIGSSLAMWEYMKRKGKNVKVIVPNYFPDFLKWMNGADDIILFDHKKSLSISLINMADLICCLDYSGLGRVDELGKAFGYSKAKRLVIDHHLGPSIDCDVMISRPEASSTCELLYRVLIAIGAESNMNTHLCEDIYAGMCTDTGRFSYNSNDPDIFVLIGELLRKGIDKDCIIRNLFNQNNEGRYRLMGYILHEKMQLCPEHKASYYAVSRDELKTFHYYKGDMEGVVNVPLEIKGIELSISLREDTEKDMVNVSIRSVGDIPANKIAEKYYNGGGHFNAAGGKLFCSIDEAVKTTKEAIENYEQLMK